MKITAQEEYGLRCLVQLAATAQSGPITVREIAAREGLSVAYVEKLLHLLSRAGLTRGVRGTKGGYCLARPAEDISLGEAVRALGETPTPENLCTQFPGNLDGCIHLSNCGIRPVWLVILYIQRTLDKVPLSSLIQDEKQVELVLLQRSVVPTQGQVA
ncbi:MAG: Rrf2 family transcriptional regulator [Acidobacteria bacterium]|nr:Rrf2 family transcriptional regulator [Acidobacteriota bacterium]